MLLELHHNLYEMRAMLYLSQRRCLTHDTWPFYFLLGISAINAYLSSLMSWLVLEFLLDNVFDIFLEQD